MGLRNIHVAGADSTTTNKSGTDWGTSLQVTTARSKLYTVAINVRTAVGADRLIWFYDTATGAETGKDPVFWVRAYNGVTTLFHAEGKLFQNGIYYVVATDEPADADTAPTVGAANDALVTIDYRVL
jgi:hypothetical protein